MKLVGVLGEKGGTTKTATSHLLCLGAHLQGIPAAYVLTDPKRKVRGEGRPYAVLDGRLPEQLALIIEASHNNLNGWLIIDGGGNRPNFDAELSKHLDITIIPFRNSEEDIDPTAESLKMMPEALAWPSAWPTNPLAISSSKYLIEGLGAAFPHRVITPPIPFVNSMSDLLGNALVAASTPVRQTARKAFSTLSDYFDTHCKTKSGQSERELMNAT
jgi:chromosome partitioning protein